MVLLYATSKSLNLVKIYVNNIIKFNRLEFCHIGQCFKFYYGFASNKSNHSSKPSKLGLNNNKEKLQKIKFIPVILSITSKPFKLLQTATEIRFKFILTSHIVPQSIEHSTQFCLKNEPISLIFASTLHYTHCARLFAGEFSRQLSVQWNESGCAVKRQVSKDNIFYLEPCHFYAQSLPFLHMAIKPPFDEKFLTRSSLTFDKTARNTKRHKHCNLWSFSTFIKNEIVRATSPWTASSYSLSCMPVSLYSMYFSVLCCFVGGCFVILWMP